MYPTQFAPPPLPFGASSLPFPTHHPPPCSFITSLNSCLNQRRIDTEFFENFINSCTSPKKSPKNPKKKRLGISETRRLISSVKSLTISLENSTNLLRVNKKFPDFDWNLEVQKCQDLKSQIESVTMKLKENEDISEFKKMVEKRKKKRMRDKKRKEAWKLEKSLRDERRNNLHKQIDNWIRSKQDVIEREKQEENLRKDADLVLAEVRGKTKDARRYLQILRELQNLRKVKAVNAKARGENLSNAADESFKRIIEGLIEQWRQLDREYLIEEHGLKLMMTSDNERVINKRKRTAFDDWEFAIFGRKLGDPRSQRDLRHLVVTRIAWDRFVHRDGTRIPLEWVMPESPSSGIWQKCLKEKTAMKFKS